MSQRLMGIAMVSLRNPSIGRRPLASAMLIPQVALRPCMYLVLADRQSSDTLPSRGVSQAYWGLGAWPTTAFLRPKRTYQLPFLMTLLRLPVVKVG